jgi:hypothetical protein
MSYYKDRLDEYTYNGWNDFKLGDVLIFTSDKEEYGFIKGNKYTVQHIDWEDYEPTIFFETYNVCGWQYTLDNFKKLEDIRDDKLNKLL